MNNHSPIRYCSICPRPSRTQVILSWIRDISCSMVIIGSIAAAYYLAAG